MEALDTGFQIVLFLKSGDRIECRFEGIGPDELAVIGMDDNIRRIPKSGVSRITSREKIGDSLVNGALIGTAVGFGTGFLGFIGANNAATSGPWWDKEAAAFATSIGLVGAGIGVIFGSGIDAAVRKPELLYEAL
ncbi:MAG: hypothetical protein ABIJ42_10525 [Acidobacteriota bacterium]